MYHQKGVETMFYDNPDLSFKILGVFYVDRNSETNVVESSRKYTSLAFRIHGDSCFSWENQTLFAPSQSIVYIPTGASYRRTSGQESLIVIHLQSFGTCPKDIEVIENARDAEPLFQKLLSTWQSRDSSAYNRSMEILYALFQLMQTITRQRTPAIPAAIKPGVEMLQKCYKNPDLRVADLAKACFISEVYFRRTYHAHFGESPQQTIVSLRFQYACELLSSGYYSQKETARLAGFSDVKYFRTAFKKQFGYTPDAYRKSFENI